MAQDQIKWELLIMEFKVTSVSTVQNYLYSREVVSPYRRLGSFRVVMEVKYRSHIISEF
jgi:hypothetical protein